MKPKNITNLLKAEAVICVIMAIFSIYNANVLSSLFAFPFEQIAFGLRWLSLKGSIFNIIAISLYFLICSLPILYLLIGIKKPYKKKDILLLINSLLLFVSLYLMINPQLIGNFLNPLLAMDYNSLIFGKTILGGVIYSGFVAYIILSLIDKTDTIVDLKLQNYMFFTLISLCMILVFQVFGLNLQYVLKKIKEFSHMGVSGDTRFFSYVFTALNYIVSSIPIMLSVNIILKVIDVGRCYFRADEENNMLSSATKLVEVSKKSLKITLIVSLGFNIMQLLFSRWLINSSYRFVLPILSIVLLFAALIFAKMVEENHSLKEDNESII